MTDICSRYVLETKVNSNHESPETVKERENEKKTLLVLLARFAVSVSFESLFEIISRKLKKL